MTPLFEYYIYHMPLPSLSGDEMDLVEREMILNARLLHQRPLHVKKDDYLQSAQKGEMPRIIEIPDVNSEE